MANNVNKPFTVTYDTRWHVIAEDANLWRVGIYSPEFNHPDEIEMLEKHNCPELFICVNGRCGLILLIDGKEFQYILQPNEAILVTDYHNGFKVDKDGYFIVVERTDVTTEFISRNAAL